MVFFVVVPILFGAFANFVIPYHVGSKDVAFPRLNVIVESAVDVASINVVVTPAVTVIDVVLSVWNSVLGVVI